MTLRNGACLAEHVDNRDEQTTQTNTAKGVRRCALERTTRRALGHFLTTLSTRALAAEIVPRAVDACDGRVHGVLDPLAEPVHRKGYVHDQPNNPCATAATVAAGWVACAART